MGPETATAPGDGPAVLHHWSARKLQPIILLYVALVFVVFMVFAYFVVHSLTAVKALATAAVAAIVPLVPGVLNRVEYRLSETGLQKRLLHEKSPREYQDVFRWDQLSHVVPIKYGFKFYKPLNEPNKLRRFWKAHLSDAFSGEFQVEAGDRNRVLEILAARGIPRRKSPERSRPDL